MYQKKEVVVEVELEVIRIKLGEEGEEAKQEINGIDHMEEIFARLNVEVDVSEGTEADTTMEVNKTVEITLKSNSLLIK